jgi:hypothetical protein
VPNSLLSKRFLAVARIETDAAVVVSTRANEPFFPASARGALWASYGETTPPSLNLSREHAVISVQR